MTRYQQVHDIRERLAQVRAPEEWFGVTGSRIVVYALPGTTQRVAGGAGHVVPITEWGASLDPAVPDLAGPVSAPWVRHPFDPFVLWVDPMLMRSHERSGFAIQFELDEVARQPCCTAHQAIDTGWRTSECRHCGAPMEFHDMEWRVVDAG